MTNITKNITLDTTAYKDLLNNNVKVYKFDTVKNTFECIGISNVDSTGALKIIAPSNGTYFIAPLDAPIYDKNNMTNVWKDNFDYTGLPKDNIFTYDTGNNNGWGNKELEYYQANNKDNVNVDNGVLNLVAQYTPAGVTDSTGTYNYTSARLKSVDSWLYGRFEVTAKLPNLQAGTWPAIWFLPKTEEFGAWPASGEIDVMEAMNNNQDLIHGSLHSANQNFKSANYHNTATITITDTENTYNVYGCTWTPEAIEFDIDGIKYFRCERDLSKEYNPKDFPWTTPFYLLLNIAIGGSAGGNVNNALFPQTMAIKDIKIYDLALSNFSLNNNANSNYILEKADNGYVLKSKFDEKNIIGFTSYIDGSANATIIFNKDTNKFDIDLKNAGDSNWKVQFFGTGISLKENATYYYKAKFNSSIARKIYIGMQNSAENTPYFLNTYNVVAGENTITGKYTATSTSDLNNFIMYLGGQDSNNPLAEHTISIEEIEVGTKVIDNITPLHIDYTSFIKTALNNNEYNGTFAQIEV